MKKYWLRKFFWKIIRTFWRYKFTSEKNLKLNVKKLKPYKKLKKINIEFDDAEIEEYEFGQYISFISIKI